MSRRLFLDLLQTNLDLAVLYGLAYAEVPQRSWFPSLKNIKCTLFGMPWPRASKDRLIDFPTHFVSEKIIPNELSANT